MENGKPGNWMEEKVISPFKAVLLQCCETPELFSLTKNRQIKTGCFLRELPYLVRILQSLCAISGSVIKLGRYLVAGESGRTILFFSEAYMLFLGQFYLSLRMGLQGFLSGLTRRGNCNQLRDILKWVFCEVLPEINEKISLLNKHQAQRD